MILTKNQALALVHTIGFLARQREAVRKGGALVHILNPVDFLSGLAAERFPDYKKYLLPHYGESDSIQEKFGAIPEEEYDITKEDTETGFAVTIRGVERDFCTFNFWKESDDKYSPFGQTMNA
jgi:hypothetical protein